MFQWRRYGFLTLTLCLFLIGMIAINPVHEVAIDDDWAYARVVEHLIATGEYRLDEWLAPNMPAQALWGALFVQTFGVSFTSLRLSTLVLVPIGLIGFFWLARAQGFDPSQAGLLTLVFSVVPLVWYTSFSFNTDSPALMLMIGAVAGYSHGLKRRSLLLMVMGSAVAALAILTRQSALAILGGLGVVWLLDRDRWRFIGAYSAGIVLPAGAAAVQLQLNSANSTWATGFVLAAQQNYFGQGVVSLAAESGWRVLAVSVYCCTYCIPLVAAVGFPTAPMEPLTLRERAGRIVPFGIALIVVIAIILTSGIRTDGSGLTPYFQWFAFSNPVRLAISLGVVGMTVVLLPVLGRRIRAFRHLAPHEQLLDGVALISLALVLLFFKIVDRYLLVLLPFVILALGAGLRRHLVPRRRWIIACSLVLWLCSVLWTRTILSSLEAEWALAEQVHADGVLPDEIYISMLWNRYYGSFDQYLATQSSHQQSYDDFFEVWQRRQRQAQYLGGYASVGENGESIQNSIVFEGEILYTKDYQGFFLEPLRVLAIRRDP